MSVIDLDQFKSKRGRVTPTASPQGLPRVRGNWAPITLAELFDRRNDGAFAPGTRLFLFLRIKSWRGQRVVRLTNEAAAAIGLDRKLKWKFLRRLESEGYVTVSRAGRQVPVVTVLLSPERDRLSP
jgi:hypothetical protein